MIMQFFILPLTNKIYSWPFQLTCLQRLMHYQIIVLQLMHFANGTMLQL